MAAPLGYVAGRPVVRRERIGGGDTAAAARVELDDGTALFVKDAPAGAPPSFLSCEADGLRWLGAASAGGGVPVPRVVDDAGGSLVLEWIEPAGPTAAAAERFGRELAATHRAGAPRFGAAVDGWIGPLALPNGGPAPPTDWPSFYATDRIEPYLRAAADRGGISGVDAEAVRRLMARIGEVAGAAGGEPPARIHGDLWSGNLVWAAGGRVYLVDPAAHGGHRETDLAMLALFGAPHLDIIRAAYDEAWPLADGWRRRVALHQLHPLLVHAVLFGGSYGARAGDAARVALSSA
jgi:fructosamine-3-kinase